MGKHDFMSPKAVANRMKAKGLQKLRWYCQMCEKQCRDQNGFKCHCASESHQRQMSIFAANPARYIEQFSQEFEQTFISILSRRYGTKAVDANQVYQELIADRQHLHMNATKWDTLSDFVMYLGREGKCRVEEAERGWTIAWIDTSDEALARKAAIQNKERQAMEDEQLEQRMLEKQVKRAHKALSQSRKDSAATEEAVQATEPKRESTDQPIKLELKPVATKGFKKSSLSSGMLRMNKPLVKSNAFKSASAASLLSKKTDADSTSADTTSKNLSSRRTGSPPPMSRRRSRSPQRRY
ncbi:hypothetical protein GGI15_003285 [Coemansia interrupta]|uniref:DNA/RNA-binding protein Kin17 WH-like domain-containing protein n=1 Tax=Coemansia interrupta TaxID=1126814 RepID=A0A9W8HAE0_9FUNG|nr:hypothetical protein GGI15_003285 [Coemansia interrupta]